MLLRWGSSIWQAGLAFVTPSCCQWCLKPLPEMTQGRNDFCDPCLKAISPTIPHRCERCSAPVGPNLKTSHGCIHCLSDVMHAKAVVSLGVYREELAKACRRCKRSGESALTKSLTGLLCVRNREQIESWKAEIVVPVPHFWWNRIQKDHASDAVAEVMGRFLMVPVRRNILHKTKWTRKQLSLSPSARRNNLRSAFRVCSAASLKGRRVLLTDDIMTTGTTVERCTQALLKAGAASVTVAVLARGIGA
ncbi:ComF family protein [Planctomicrobium sp. SH668]|uniref:ComF family protein n=1 Tax=Planctomicrobium sp. SH668 TaxID=3448126 RepID=UPI003F5AFC2E